ncbi:hypothetical protein LJD47_26455, partial [Escherichia coli]|nr:hypothetical protein [Escherichia coli]
PNSGSIGQFGQGHGRETVTLPEACVAHIVASDQHNDTQVAARQHCVHQNSHQNPSKRVAHLISPN